MAETTVKKRVHRLETLMAQLIKTVDRTDQQIAQTQHNLDQFSAEMRESRQRSEREMQDFKAEMRESRECSEREMQDFKAEMREFRTSMNKQWGELSSKLGTMAEDLVAPSIARILRDMVGCSHEDIEYVAVRVKKRHPATRHQQEFDVVAVCGEYVLINETKSKLSPEAIEKFVNERLTQAREFFPEYAGKKIIGAVASLYVDESLVRYGERLGLIVLGFGEDVMEVLNQPGFVPTTF